MAKIHYARVNDRKEILLPSHLARELGLARGDEIRIEPNGRGVYLHPSIHTLKRILSGLDDCPEKPELFFGGYGEPLSHPNVLDMVFR